MTLQFRTGSSAQPKGKGDKLIVHVGSNRSRHDSQAAKELAHFWPSFGEIMDAWLKKGARLGEARLFELGPSTRLGVIIGMRSDSPGPIADPELIAKGIATLAAERKPTTSVHVARFGGLHQPSGLWKGVEAELRRAFLSRNVSVMIYDTYLRAIADGDLEAVKALVDAGADPNKPTVSPMDLAILGSAAGGHLPLSWAVSNARVAEPIVRYLLELGVKRPTDLLADALTAHRNDDRLGWLVEQLLDEGDRKMLKPDILHHTNHVPYARRLIEMGASATAVDENDRATALHFAARFGDEELMKLLIDHGASVKAKDRERQTPLEWAQDWGRKDNATLLKKWTGAPPFDWDKAETELYDAAVAEIRRIAKKHAKITFSAFGFDCDSENGSLIIKLNAATKPVSSKYTLTGNFSHGFEAIGSDRRVKALLSETSGSAERGRRLMAMVCRVAVRMEREGAFSPLARSEGFQVFVEDHDEPTTTSMARLERVRREAAPKGSGGKAIGKAKTKGPKVAAKTAPAAGARKSFRMEYRRGSSQKFWEIAVNGSTHTVRFGRIGAAGQTKTKSFSSEEAARDDAFKLIAEKRKKGYQRDRSEQ